MLILLHLLLKLHVLDLISYHFCHVLVFQHGSSCFDELSLELLILLLDPVTVVFLDACVNLVAKADLSALQFKVFFSQPFPLLFKSVSPLFA